MNHTDSDNCCRWGILGIGVKRVGESSVLGCSKAGGGILGTGVQQRGWGNPRYWGAAKQVGESSVLECSKGGGGILGTGVQER